MILYIVTDVYDKYPKNAGWFHHRNTLEEAAGDACVVLHYKQATLENVRRIQPWAICHSGGGTDYKDYDVLTDKEYQKVVKESDVAQIGFCGGHQILAVFFGGKLGPMRRLRPDEPDLSSYRPNYFKEWGVYPVRIVKPDPLFKGFGKVIRVQEYHYWEVKRLGTQLVLLASSTTCRVQAYRHRTRPIYGTQFHPEQSPDTYPDGKKVLENFFALAREHQERLAESSSSPQESAG